MRDERYFGVTGVSVRMVSISTIGDGRRRANRAPALMLGAPGMRPARANFGQGDGAMDLSVLMAGKAFSAPDLGLRAKFVQNPKIGQFFGPKSEGPEKPILSAFQGFRNGGRDRDRTCDPYDVNVVLSR